MKKKGLYLDDIRSPRPSSYEEIDWTIVRSYDEFVDYIQNNSMPDIISFDHDLGDEHMKFVLDNAGKEAVDIPYESFKEKTGLDAAKYLTDLCMENHVKIPTCTIHSANPWGANNIYAHLWYKSWVDDESDSFKVYRTIW